MASPQEQAQVIVWFIEFKSATQVQRKFWTTYNTVHLQDPQFMNGMKDLRRQVAYCQNQNLAALAEASMTLKRIQETFRRSPRKSNRSAAQHLQIPRSTVHDIVHKNYGFMRINFN
ncbi:hypothetical protein AVEN_23664-1 [Araneus ventricosus]|uniref:DUF4817 domain-containing protein n=1 Tax=Araneus ventricosus TaxID=182803 RepID=A0A4Y2BI40_ARAVE|nr:hypothetical protein AVEN_23664-1 [Araneus ventricosus]